MERYWGGYTEHGELLHFVVGSTTQHAQSACGLVLTGGASSMPPDMLSGTATCKRCDAASRQPEHGNR